MADKPTDTTDLREHERRVCTKTYIRVPPLVRRVFFDKAARAIVGAALAPVYRHLARRRGQPGVEFGTQSAALAAKSLFSKGRELSLAELYEMVFWPIESTRYFEFDAAWRFLCDLPIRRYLDVSSPRLFPLLMALRKPELTAELVNPDATDLRKTQSLVRSCRLESRCRLSNCLIEQSGFPPESFDAISSISVIEHIPADTDAARKMWALLRPGGSLVVSAPCAASAEEQYIDVDFYGLQKPCPDGFFFHQYVYDQALLEERFFPVFGAPRRQLIFGEKEKGSLLRGLVKKWTGGLYPRWKEPYLMAHEFQAFESLSDLPGEGVVIMEFVK